MTCPTEFDISLYADGELSAEATREVAAHLDDCTSCGELLSQVLGESRLLIHALQGAVLEQEAELVSSAARDSGEPRSIFWLATSVSGVAVSLRAALWFLFDFELPAALDWLDPSRLSGQLNLLAGIAAYGAAEEAATMTAVTNTMAFATLTFLTVASAIFLLRRYRGAAFVLGSLTLLAIFPAFGQAIDLRTGNQIVTVAVGETLDDTLIAFGESVNIDGTLTGDLIAFARRVNVRGTVLGNVIGMGQSVTVEGTVRGSVFGFGQTVRADGQLGRNFYAFGSSTDVGGTGRIEGNAAMFSGEGLVDGVVADDLMMFGERLTIVGEVGRNVRFRGRRMSVQPLAQVGGNLEASVSSEQDVQIDASANVVGQTTIDLVEPDVREYITVSFYVGQAIRIAAALATGLLLFWLVPVLRSVRLDTPHHLITAGGVGFLVVIATPVAALITAITLVGIPVSIVGIALWLLCLYLSKIVVAYFIGTALLKPEDDGLPSTALAMLCGLVLIFIAVNIPLVGTLINVLLIVIGLGALLVTLYRSTDWRAPRQTKHSPSLT